MDVQIAALPQSLQGKVFNFEKEPNYTITTNFISGPGIIFSGENSTSYDIDLYHFVGDGNEVSANFKSQNV